MFSSSPHCTLNESHLSRIKLMSCTGTSGKFNSTLSLCLRENCAPAFSNNFDGLLLYSYAVIQLHYCYTADCTSFPYQLGNSSGFICCQCCRTSKVPELICCLGVVLAVEILIHKVSVYVGNYIYCHKNIQK